jgi:uncharacterized protein YdeI (BOF family)
MRKQTRIFWLLAGLAFVLEVSLLSSRVNAQQNPAGTQAQQPSQSSQEPSQQQPSQNPPSQAPNQTSPSQQPNQTSPSQQAPNAEAGQAAGAQTFTGTIVKQGDKYVLQDTATGKTYDIDHQDIVGQHVGRKVRVTGTLDSDGKTIHIGR